MSSTITPKDCPSCGNQLQIERLKCERCSTAIEGQFRLPRLARLSRDDRRCLELFVICRGNLKLLCKHLEVSYPTVKKRLELLVANLETEIERDEQMHSKLLEDISEGKISAHEAIEKLKKG